jgi:hypothetical protein
MKTNKPMWLKSNDYDLEKEVLFITKDKRFRIIRTTDNDYNLADACQHFFSAKDRPDTPEHKLKKQEQDFRKKFENFGAVIIRLEVTSRKFCYQLHLSFLDRKRDLIWSKSKWRWRPSTERAVWPSRVVVLSPFLA